MTADRFRMLTDELDQWSGAGEMADFWWRDDDAVACTPPLGRLLKASEGCPLSLAVVPALMDPHLGTALARECPHVNVLQHGYAHVNHAPPGQGGWEQGLHRPMDSVLAELVSGRDRLQDTFAERFLPVLVPPWNRIDLRLFPALPGAGFAGVSTFGTRPARSPAPELVQINCHCDVIRWKAGKCFAGAESCLRKLAGHLRDRRLGTVDRDEPTGLLTHHLDMDGPAWEFVRGLAEIVRAHPAARWIGVSSALGRRPGD